ncbi:hypothetical protein LWI29_033812 [Acer saccharum]|uniref:Uncharacterized protein n=1 Tax=Acer saccharum TaxID=4024 RepID=A0AA39S1E6_ACESA|nr:hypothetical protein LWI29_033812 [Acer saccharum]
MAVTTTKTDQAAIEANIEKKKEEEEERESKKSTQLPPPSSVGKAGTWRLGADAYNACGMCITRSLRLMTSFITIEGRNSPRKNNKGSVNLDDYRPNDPVPGSSAVTSGPIEHGTPLMPYIPKRPPYQPGNVGSPLPPSPA